MFDVAIAGGGPAGLACAIEAALRGLEVVVLERRGMPCDKACGEGLMPAGVRALEWLGVRPLLDAHDAAPFCGIRYVQEDGTSAEGLLPEIGLGVRRVALAAAMLSRARAVGAEVRERVEVKSHVCTGHGVIIETSAGRVEARMLVAADGLSSKLRAAQGLDVVARGPKRFGLRRHFAVTPWTSFVEVHFAADAEAYITPAGARRVGVAFLWDDARAAHPISFEAMLARFPGLAPRLAGAPHDSSVRGAGPLLRRSRGQVADRFALIGDAAGYVDAITGEGLSLALASAAALGRTLPGALAQGASAQALRPYEVAYQRAYGRYAWLARTLVYLSARPALRRRIIRVLGAHPRLFDRVLRAVAG
jgi:flavin-dependent dehydrogenase